MTSENDKLKKFRGSLQFVHEREGHHAPGTPYWPGGRSGMTLNPGVDLAYVDPDILPLAYPHLADKLYLLAKWREYKGEIAKEHFDAVVEVAEKMGVTVNREQALHAMPFVAERYWNKACARWPILMHDDTPGVVQTAILSLVFNRGYGNKKLSVLDEPLERRAWNLVGRTIAGMQQDHTLRGVSLRRRKEGAIIIKEYPQAPVVGDHDPDDGDEDPSDCVHGAPTRFTTWAKEYGVNDNMVNWVFAVCADPLMHKVNAYIRLNPGTSKKAAANRVTKWLKNPNLQRLIQHVLENPIKRKVVDETWVLSRLQENVTMGQQGAPYYGVDPETSEPGVVLGFTQPDLTASNAALKLIMQHLGMLNVLSPSDKATIEAGAFRRISVEMSHDDATAAYMKNMRSTGTESTS